MSRYKLIAFDMDGTLLNSKKEIDKETLDAIKRASNEGKIVALSLNDAPFGGSFMYCILYFIQLIILYIGLNNTIGFFKTHYIIIWQFTLTVFFLIIRFSCNHINIIILLLCKP